MKTKPRSERGFTLVELMIAASMTTIVLLSLYSAFHTGVTSYNRMDSSFNVYQSARIILNRVESDLKNSFAYTQNDAFFKGEKESLEFFSVVQYFDQNGAAFPVICKIRYTLADNILKRSVYQGDEALKQGGKPSDEELSASVKAFSFGYVCATGNQEKPYDTQTVWPQENDDAQKKSLPLAITVNLFLTQQSGAGIVDSGEFNTTVAVPLGGNVE